MKFLGNIIWWVFGGVILGLIWFLIGLLLTVTVIGIPFGAQCFKIAGFTFFLLEKTLSWVVLVQEVFFLILFGFLWLDGSLLWLI